MLLSLIRKIKSNHSIIGELSIDGEFFGYTLELPWKNNQHNISCIPLGTYKVEFFYAEHWKKFVPVVMNVPNRSGIEIHVANYPKDILGCIGVGFTHAPDFIGDSVNAITSLYAKMHKAADRQEEITIEIIEV